MVSGGRRVRQSEYQIPDLTHMAPCGRAGRRRIGSRDGTVFFVRVERDANPTSRLSAQLQVLIYLGGRPPVGVSHLSAEDGLFIYNSSAGCMQTRLGDERRSSADRRGAASSALMRNV